MKYSWFLTLEGYLLWRKSLLTAASVVRRYHIPVRHIKLHHHWIPTNCDLGFAESGERIIVLCDREPETVLHELAHLWTQDNHTKDWARALFFLHKRYLSKEQQAFYLRESKRMYKTAKWVAENEKIGETCICGRRV